MKRRFIVVMGSQDLSSRRPLLARIISSSFYLSHGIRRDVTLEFYLWDAKRRIVFQGGSLKHVHVDEASLIGIIRKIEARIPIASRKIKIHDGITLEGSVEFGDEPGFIIDEHGTPLELVISKITGSPVFIIPLHNTLPNDVRENQRVKVTSKPKQPDVVMAILNMKLDRLYL
ncbi:MAG: hypothetical protein ACP5IE_02670 [Infirmifilum sp.]